MFNLAELGNRLKEARMAKGYSLEDLQEITKIQKRYLSAIEEGNFSVMPGAFYVRAFIKQYAEAVGLDANEILETYKNEIPENKAKEATNVSSAIQQPKGGTNRRTNATQPSSNIKTTSTSARKMSDLMPKIAVAVIVVAVIAIVWFLFVHSASNKDVTPDVKQEQTTKDQTTTTTNTAVDNQEEEKAAEEKATAGKAEKEKAAKEKAEKEKAEKEKAAGTLSDGQDAGDGATTTYTLSDTEQFKVRVDVTGDNWVGITDQNGSNLSTGKMYAKGEKLEYDAKDQSYIRIRLGAATYGKVYVNDQEVKLAVPASQRVTQNIVIKTK